jgi:hypothetical protein
MHFSLYGVAQATQQEIQAQHDHPPVNPASQDEDDLAQMPTIEQDDLASLPTETQLKLIKSYERTVKKDMARLDKIDCNNVGVVAHNFTTWQARVVQFGVQARFKDQITKDANALADKLEKCPTVACGVCTGKSGDRKSVDAFLVLAAWAESVNEILGNTATATYWRSLANKCAESAGLPPPQPAVASCEGGPDCKAATEIRCP